MGGLCVTAASSQQSALRPARAGDPPPSASSGSSNSKSHGAVGRLAKLPQASAVQARKRDRLVGQAENTCRPSPPQSPIATPALRQHHPVVPDPAFQDSMGALDLGSFAKEAASLESASPPYPPPPRLRGRRGVAPARRRRPQGIWKALRGTAGSGMARPAGPDSTPTCGGPLPEELEGWGMLLGINARKRSMDDSLAPWGIALPIPT